MDRIPESHVAQVIGPAALVGVFYAVSLIGLFGLTHHDPRDFIEIGYRFLDRSQASPVIHVDAAYHRELAATGYDGQFYYYIALDPVNARWYIDEPSYRYERILYPALARLLSFGQVALIPYVLIAINWVALTGGTLALVARLRLAGVSGWPALVFGLAPGMYTSFRRDLAEPLAYALVALALYLFYRGGRYRVLSAIVFALAVLTRETTAVFALACAGAIAFPALRRGLRRMWSPDLTRLAIFMAIALGPALGYKAAITVLVGGRAFGDPFEPLPFLGLAAYWPFSRLQITEVATIVLPSLLAAAVAGRALWRRQASAETLALLVSVALFVVFLNHYSYGDFHASSRVVPGIALAAVAALSQLGGARRAWFLVTSALWLAPLPFVILSSLGRIVGIT